MLKFVSFDQYIYLRIPLLCINYTIGVQDYRSNIIPIGTIVRSYYSRSYYTISMDKETYLNNILDYEVCFIRSDYDMITCYINTYSVCTRYITNNNTDEYYQQLGNIQYSRRNIAQIKCEQESNDTGDIM